MGDDIAIRIENVGKRYRLGVNHDYRTLRDGIAAMFGGQRGKPAAGRTPTEIWAVKDLSLEVNRGEVIGIIGRNGSGKSTLLKLLTRITRPDTGRIEYRGRIGALLEVGTGFHPELTGRENIYMNGTILGMSRREIAGKFDEIVDFSGVEDFLETPVKRYSSGMRVRLGFAVAAHLDPEILVVDEVLAVGDAEFQRKCLGRMGDVAREGRTVLFVSHQMEAIQSLCSRAAWLHQGQLKYEGSSSATVAKYLSSNVTTSTATPLEHRSDRSGEGNLRLVSLGVDDGAGGPPRTGAPALLRVAIRGETVGNKSLNLSIRVPLRDQMDRLVTFLSNELTNDELVFANGHRAVELTCHIEKLPLVPGLYVADIALWSNGKTEDKIMRAYSFEVGAGDYFGFGRGIQIGCFQMSQAWRQLQWHD